jgi:hypothetical protein
MKVFTSNQIEPIPVIIGGFEYPVHPDVAGTIAGLRAHIADLNTEAEQTAIAIADLEADLRREREDRAAEQRRYATHMNACPVLDELMAEDHRKAQANR